QPIVLKDVSTQRKASVFSILKQIFRQSTKFKIVALLTALGYWIVYGYSSGMFFYYSFDATQYLKQSGMTNPYFVPPASMGNLNALYDSGMVWFPTSHLQFDILIGSTFFSVLLSILFSLTILLLIYSFPIKGVSRRWQGFAGLFGVIPAIFTGGCCAVPIAALLLGSIVPSTVLTNIAFGDPLLLNLFIAILMFSSIYYTGRKIIRTANSCEVCKL
ncbi:MAG: hypothetical protein JRN20_21695, partial [Nitrososphaerota archaeon]|nr:hypothetical protein [Nitrososphaerota archaeon]